MNPKLSLSETQRIEAQKFVRQGKANARTLTRAWVLLKLADGWDEAKIAETFAISQATVKNVARRFAEGGSTWCCMIKCSSAGGKPPDWPASRPFDCSDVVARLLIAMTTGRCACWLAKPWSWVL